MEDVLLWFLNRATGFVALALLTASTALGILASGGRARQRVPTFVTQALHRNFSLLAVVLLLAHVIAAVVHEFVDIRWWHAIVPFSGGFERLWVGLGVLALDLIAVITVTSLVRDRLNHRTWLGVHVTAYASWALAVAHTLGVGTDIGKREVWAVGTALGCVVVFGIAVVWRLVLLRRDDPEGVEVP